MGYADIVRKCAELFAAKQVCAREEKILAGLMETFPTFTLQLKNGDRLRAKVYYGDNFTGDNLGQPIVILTVFRTVLTAQQAVAFAKWILDVFEGIPTEQ